MSGCTEDSELLFWKVGVDGIVCDLFWGVLGAFCQINFVSRRSCLACSLGSLESRHKSVDDVIRFNRNLRMLSQEVWARVVCDECEFQGLREILFLREKLGKMMFPRVLERFLASRLSFVSLTDVFRNLGFALCWRVWFFQVQTNPEIWNSSWKPSHFPSGKLRINATKAKWEITWMPKSEISFILSELIRITHTNVKPSSNCEKHLS